MDAPAQILGTAQLIFALLSDIWTARGIGTVNVTEIENENGSVTEIVEVLISARAMPEMTVGMRSTGMAIIAGHHWRSDTTSLVTDLDLLCVNGTRSLQTWTTELPLLTLTPRALSSKNVQVRLASIYLRTVLEILGCRVPSRMIALSTAILTNVVLESVSQDLLVTIVDLFPPATREDLSLLLQTTAALGYQLIGQSSWQTIGVHLQAEQVIGK